MWRKALFLGAILSVVFVFPFAMQAAVSTSVDLYGGYVEDVVIGPSGEFMVLTMSPNGAWLSTDGSSYTGPDSSTHDMGNCTAGGADANYFYADCGIELWQSGDGLIWTDTGLSNVGQYVYVDDNRIIQVMRGSDEYMTLAISEDQGATWTEATVTGVENIVDMSFAGDVGYMVATLSSEYEIYKTTDGGATWSGTGYTISSGTNFSIATKASDDSYVGLRVDDSGYLSTDGGSSFTDLGLSMAGEMQFVGDTLWSGLDSTDDDGATWTQRDGGDVAVGVNDVAISGSTILAGTGLGTAISTDDGTTWTEATDGIEALEVEQIAQKTGDRDKVILAIYGGVARTENFTDSNPTWVLDTEVGSSTAVFYGTDIALVGASENIYYSTDDGVTWTSAGPAGGTVTDFIRSDSVYYAAYNGGVLSSADGITWTDFGLNGYAVNAIAKTSNERFYAVIGGEANTTGANSGIYKYNGSSWSQVYSGGFYTDIEVVDNIKGSNVVYAVSAVSGDSEFGEVIMSTDYGTSWDDITANGLATDGWFHQVVAQGNNKDVLYVSTARPAGTGTIYKTLDGGDTWSLFLTGLRDETFQAMYWDDLMVGSNAGLMNVNSEAKIAVTRTKKKVKSGNKSRLKVTLTDKDTGDALANKPVKLYRRYKTTGTWKLLKTKKTGAKGKTNFYRKITKKTYFKVSWKPVKAAVKRAYGSSAYKKLTNVKIK